MKATIAIVIEFDPADTNPDFLAGRIEHLLDSDERIMGQISVVESVTATLTE